MTTITAAASPGRRSGRRRQLWRHLSVLERIVAVFFVAIIVVAAIGPWLAPYPTTVADPAQRLLPPGAAHWFGTDENGMDVFSRLLAAPRIDVTIALIATLLSVLIGAPLGVLAGYFEQHPRRAAALAAEGLLRLTDVLQAFPVFILAMVLVAIRGTGPENVIFAVAFVPARAALHRGGTRHRPHRPVPVLRPPAAQRRADYRGPAVGDRGLRGAADGRPELRGRRRQPADARAGGHDRQRRQVHDPGSMVGIAVPRDRAGPDRLHVRGDGRDPRQDA
jgi:hypothetical protein